MIDFIIIIFALSAVTAGIISWIKTLKNKKSCSSIGNYCSNCPFNNCNNKIISDKRPDKSYE